MFNSYSMLARCAILSLIFSCFVITLAKAASDYESNDIPVTLQDNVDIGVYGSASKVLSSANSSNNKLEIMAGAQDDPNYAFGGLDVQTNQNASSANNKVIINGGNVVSNHTDRDYSGSAVAGFAYSDTGATATSNNHIMTMQLGDIEGALLSGWARANAGDAFANSNTLTMTGGRVLGGLGITAGWAVSNSGSVYASNNIVNFSDSAYMDSRGGLVTGWASLQDGSGDAIANANQTTINGGTLNGGYGVSSGFAEAKNDQGSATANNNVLTINAGIVDGSLISGASYLADGINHEAIASSHYNVLNINGGTVDNGDMFAGWARAHNGEGNASSQYNIVNMSGGELKGGNNLYAGWARVSSFSATRDGNATVNNNVVNFSGGNINDGGSVYGAYAKGYTGNIVANDNIVNINGGIIDGDVYGSYLDFTTGNGEAINNILTINNGTINGNIYASYADAATGASINNTGNTINFSQNDFISNTSSIYGGYAEIQSLMQTGFANVIQNNSLNIDNVSVAVQSVQNFENYNFILPSISGQTMLSTTDAVELSGGFGANAWQSNINIYSIAKGTNLATDYKVVLIDNVDTTAKEFNINGANFSATNNIIKNVPQSYSVNYDLLLSLDANSLSAQLASANVSEQAKAPVEGRAAGIGILANATNTLADIGIDSAAASANAQNAQNNGVGFGFSPFAAMNGGYVRYNTGSHVDVQGLSGLIGLSKSFNLASADLLAGVFFESGYGSYKSYYSGSDGSGDSNYYGGGILFRASSNMGLYVEASARIGSLYNNFTGDNTIFGTPEYKTNSLYYGGHLGLGYIWNISEKSSINASAKAFWTHQDANNVNILGDQYKFKAIDSYSVRPTVRYSYAINQALQTFAGLGYEYEFDARARASTFGLDIPAPSAKGGSGVGEIGLSYKANDSPLSVELGAQGFAGKKQGINGFLNVKIEF